ncbi:MAG: RNA-binding riboflavin kinase RibR [candidate division WS6 bacterium OLB20]|uniref:riboflavin kinase n=1 Tax=candidate division WS6 bacterium OLB20 TaxID=1617426 RepID=A0A136M060_9BACT|nr:MAG: RNA-binding riboflavin kinase RibR [candidate division WS6 bacterium OLB20]
MKQTDENWVQATVLHGDRQGRTIGYPTVNLDPSLLPVDLTRGVYACTVRYDGMTYLGALYFGPKLVNNKEADVLEIHLLEFNKTIYGEEIQFKLADFIRGVMDFDSYPDLRKQLMADIAEIEERTHAAA